jgi:two-component system, NarL family, sensor kinase
MLPAQHNEARTIPQLLASIGRRLRRVFAPSGNALLSAGLRYSLLTFYAAIVYVLVLALGGITNQSASVPWWLNLIVLLIIVPTFLPVHARLRRSVNQLVYGQHDNSYALLVQLNHHLEASAAPNALLPTITATLAATLKLPYVAIETERVAEQHSAAFGAPPTDTERVSIPLAYRGAMLGTLHVSSRRSDERLSADDLRLLHDLAHQVGITLHAAQLTADLQASREQLVTAREEERRRIRRDLHDGLGPTLAALRLQLSAVRHMIRQSPDDAELLIDELRQDVRSATAEIRQLVYALRPPMLDEFGLVSALRNLELTSNGLTRSVEAPEPLPLLPAALEVALYRIAAEALHNIVRHAQATHCMLCLTLDATTITLSVTDNGCGLPATYLAGVGHCSMHERAAELSGSVTISSAPTGGTGVTAIFPFKGTPDA